MAFLMPSGHDAEQAENSPITLAAAAAAPVAEPPPARITRHVRPGIPLVPRPHAVRPVPVATLLANPSQALPPPPTMTIAPEPDKGEPPPPIIPDWPEGLARPDRWSASLWAIARQGGGTLTPGGQLGGSQAGLRLLRRIDRGGALSASLRLSAPWSGMGREMGLGLDWRPSRHLPLRLLVEQRVALDKGRDGVAMVAVAGIGPRPIAPGLILTAYAQAGAVLRDGTQPFADGAARASRALSDAVDLGLGLWGGAQRDAQRLDIGPTLGVAVPVAERRVRLSLDWRQRIAGAAAPNSGPALTLAGDF
ncbi:hypothetical protein [Sphingomonas sp.]|uniref:hypothetical protein n=1 Tax=Sphingomonas sp. TaxID=28214 RepID=UPI0031E485E5